MSQVAPLNFKPSMDDTQRSSSRTSSSNESSLGAKESSGPLPAPISAPPPAPSTEAPAPPSAAAPVIEPPKIIKRQLNGYVGFANLPSQWHRRSIKKGFNLNLIVVGQSGLGKSTFINTLFNQNIFPPRAGRDMASELPSTIAIESTSGSIEEDGVRLRLNIIDTPGYSDFIDNTKVWQPIVDCIESKYDAYLEYENKPNRRSPIDNRIHACLFFIEPTGHSLKPLDIETMKALHKRTNLIPLIAKSDILTAEEFFDFKKRVLRDIQLNQIEIFYPPSYDMDDESTRQENQDVTNHMPFAIVGSLDQVKRTDGTSVRGRSYPWGVVEVENENHCDFLKLRQMLIRTHMEEIRERAINHFYEKYRTERLLAMGVTQNESVFREVNPAVRVEEERALQNAKLQKMEIEMKQVFMNKVTEKEAKLRASEEELFTRHRTMKEELLKQKADLEDKKARLESGRYYEEKKGRKGFSLR